MDGMNRVLIWLPLPRWLRDVGWGVLLVPVMLLIATISSGGSAAKSRLPAKSRARKPA